MIHPTAIIHPGAILADNVTVGPYSIIGADVEIASGTDIKSHVVIGGPTKIGRENHIYQFSSIGEMPQDKKYDGERTYLQIGDRNIIREYVTLNRGTATGVGKTVIGHDNLFMAYCHVAHDCIVGNHTIFANAASLAGHVEIGDHATLGGFTSVHQFVSIGERAFCGLGSVVVRDIPPYSIAAGNRARAVGINKEGLNRIGFSAELIKALHVSFRSLFSSRRSRAEVYKLLKPLCDRYPEVTLLVNFVKNSKRGIAR